MPDLLEFNTVQKEAYKEEEEEEGNKKEISLSSKRDIDNKYNKTSNHIAALQGNIIISRSKNSTICNKNIPITNTMEIILMERDNHKNHKKNTIKDNLMDNLKIKFKNLHSHLNNHHSNQCNL